jgi:LPS-assembly protein
VLGVNATYRGSARFARLAGATALACVMAYAVAPSSAQAQAINLEDTGVSRDAEMLLEADTIVYDNDRNTVTAVGGVQIDYDNNRLVAQRVTYDRATSRLIASGGVEIVDPQGTRIYSDELDVTDDFRDAFVRTLRVETADKTYFAAESADRRDGAVTTFNYGVYTACEPCEEKPDRPPIWRVKAQKIIWNGETKIVRFERARFEFFGMPLAFLPVFEIADPTVKRKTGFLIPSYKSADDLGHGVQVPFYWALGDTYDLTLKPTVYSKQGFLGEAEWRQRFNNGEYSITVAGIRQQSPEEFYQNSRALTEFTSADNEDWRAMIGSKGRFTINPRWTFGWDVMAQTDKNFSYTYGVDGYDQLKRRNQVYLTGLNDRNYFDLRAYKFNTQEATRDYRTDTGAATSARNSRQPWVLPSFDYAYTPDEPIAGGELNIDVNMQVLSRSEIDQRFLSGASINPQSSIRGIDGTSARLTAEAEWKRTFITQGGFVLTPLLAGRGDAIGVDYNGASVARIEELAGLNNFDADIRSSYYRAMATAGLEARWPVLFSTTSSTHVLEPMGQLFARPDAPYGETLGIPNEDAQSLVFDASNLFERDKFSGYDRIEGGVRANLGVRYSGAFGNGWSTNALFGQSFHLAGDNPYTSPDLVHVGAFSGLETDRSDYVGSIGLISPVGLSLAAGARFDEKDFEVRRTDLSASYASTPVTVSGVYSFIDAQPDYGFPEDRHEVRGNASLRFQENWRLFGGGTYDITSETVVRKSIGFAYDDECFTYVMTASEVQNPGGSEKSRSFGFQISLRTIGDFGSTAGGTNSTF